MLARVRETGIGHDLFADPSSTAQPWRVDLIPLVVPEEWRWLERALIQRARLFEGILADLYGPQKLLAAGAPVSRVTGSPSRHGAPSIISTPAGAGAPMPRPPVRPTRY